MQCAIAEQQNACDYLFVSADSEICIGEFKAGAAYLRRLERQVCVLGPLGSGTYLLATAHTI